MDDEIPSGRRKGWLGLRHFLQADLDFLFYHNTEKPWRGLQAAWLVGLFLAGVYLWGVFFSWGNISLDFLDWAEVTGPRYALLQDAARNNELPLHATDRNGLRGVTDRYLAIADTPFSPQFYLLRFISISQFIFFDTLLLYGSGFIGLVLIFYHLRLSPYVFTLVFLLFNFNGNLTIHLAVGHAVWAGQFLLPYVLLLVLVLIERQKAGWLWVLGMAFTLLVILLQGDFHLYVWCLMFLVVLGVFNLRLIKPALLGALFSVLLGLPRLLPPALILKGVTQEYLGGFASLTDLLESMVVLRDPDRITVLPSHIFQLNGWEVDFYVGLLGAVVLLFFGVVYPLIRDHRKESVPVQILLPSLVFTILSLGSVFDFVVRLAPIPPLTGERVTSRMFILPFSFMLILGAIYLQEWIVRVWSKGVKQMPPIVQVSLLLASIILFHDLDQHLQAWRIRYLDGLTYLFPKIPFDPLQNTIHNQVDPIYTGLLVWGSAAGGAALIVLVGLILNSRRRVS